MNERTRKITGIAIFAVIVAALQLFSNYITFGPVSITLSLIPIVIGAIIYGPTAGLFLGMVNGLLVLLAPGTQGFLSFSFIGTVILCLAKTGIAGLVAGYLYKLLYKLPAWWRVFLTSIVVPIINTGIFAIIMILFYSPKIKEWMGESTENIYQYIFLTMIGINFIIEFLVNSLLSPTILTLVNYYKKHYK